MALDKPKILVLAIIVASTCAEPAINSTKDHHDDKVHLISWRWEEYRTIFNFTLIILIASLLKIGFHHIPRLANHFPESCLLILIGIFFGLTVRFVFKSQSFPIFTSNLFFNALLPPIILDAAYSIYDEDFFSNLNAILIFAVLGTILNVFFVGSSLYAISLAGLMGDIANLDLIQCLVFSSIISAVDPVAVLAIFEEIGVNMVLYFLVFGESLLNDGVTIVIYNTMTSLSKQDVIPWTQYVVAVISFFTVVFGGILIGIVTGALTALILRLTKHARVLEPLVIITMAYFSFIMAELLHWSGIISLIACGIIQKRYAFINASAKTYTTVKYSVKTLSSVSDCVIFIFLGKVTTTKYEHMELAPLFVLWTLLLCTLVRFITVFILSDIINRRRMAPISKKEQFIMAYGGLRGAVGFSLAYVLDSKNPLKNVFLTTTLIVVFFTVFVQGGTIKIMVNRLKIKKKKSKDRSHIICDVNKKTMDHVMTGVESVAGNFSLSSYYFNVIETLDNLYIKRWLLSKKAQDRMTLRLKKITLDEHYARLYGPTVLICRNEASAAIEPDSRGDKDNEGEMTGNVTEEKKQLSSSSDSYRASLFIAFRSNSYEKARNRLSRDDTQDRVLQQLENKSRQAKMIEERLQLQGGVIREDDEEEDDECVELRSKEEIDKNQVNIPMIRGRSRSSVTAAQLRKQYLEAKSKYKSTQLS